MLTVGVPLGVDVGPQLGRVLSPFGLHVAPLGQMVVFGSLVDTVMHKFGADSGMDVGVHFRV